MALANKARPRGQRVVALVPDWRMVVPSVNDLTDDDGDLSYPCDLVRVSTDGDQLAMQPAGHRHRMDDKYGAALVPTAGTNWAWSETTKTGTATAADGTSLTFATGLTLGQKYLVTYTMTRTGGTLTPYLGTAAGTTQSAGGTYQNVLTATGNGNLLFTAGTGGNAFSGTVSVISVYPLSPPLSSRAWEPMPAKKIVAVVQGTAIVTDITLSRVYVGYLAKAF